MDELEPHEARAFADLASGYLANLEHWEAQAEANQHVQHTANTRALVKLLKELRAKYPQIMAYSFRGWIFNPVRIDHQGADGRKVVIDFLQVVYEGAIYDVEEDNDR